MAKPEHFLITLSGARTDVLEQCPSERVKFQSLGWAILITSVMATVSMWFALTSAMGINPYVAFPVAVIWGLIIMGIDRWLVTSLPATGTRRYLMALPRLVLALLLGTIISTPIVLRVFESEINNQIAVIKADRAASFLSSQERNSVQAQVTKWQNTVDNLNSVIQSGGLATIDPANDPEVQSLTAQRTAALKLQAQYYHDWQCQLYGGCGAPKGDGVLAQASEARYNSEVAQVNSLTNQIQQRENALQSSDNASKQVRLKQAEQELPAAQAQLTAATDRQNTLISNFDVTNNAANGLLIRLQALAQLTSGNTTLAAARTLLFLLFLLIEVLPVTVKLLQQPGPYEELLQAMTRQELRLAKRSIPTSLRTRKGWPADPDLATNPAPTIGDRVDQVDREVGRLWDQHTRMEPLPDWQGSAVTEDLPADRDEADEASRYDEALRGLVDLRGPSGFERRPGGFEASQMGSGATPSDGAGLGGWDAPVESFAGRHDDRYHDADVERPGGFELSYDEDEL
jgi:Domain of unknown function (DUF4407)